MNRISSQFKSKFIWIFQIKRSVSNLLYVLLVLIFMLSSSFVKQAFSQEEEENQIFTIVENQPQFPGGQVALNSYISSNLQYPENARKNGIEGTVYATFVVEEDGSISNIRILKGLDSECDEEVIRVLSNMPKWKPGTQRGKTVRVQFNIPVRFGLGKR